MSKKKVVVFSTAVLMVMLLVLTSMVTVSMMPVTVLSEEKSTLVIGPETVCESDFIDVWLYHGVDPKYDFTLWRGFFYWTEEDDTRPYRSTYFEIKDPAFLEQEESKSPYRRYAPSTEGVWYANIEGKIQARLFGLIPASQEFSITSEEPIVVRECAVEIQEVE